MPFSSGDEAPISQVAHNTLSPKSTYPWPSIVPVVGFPSADPSHVDEQVLLHVSLHVSLHEDEQSLAQSPQVGLVELPLHDEEQSEQVEPVALPWQL